MVSYTALLSLLPILAVVNCAAVEKRQARTFSVTSGTKVPVRDAAPVGISYEFFAFPGYVKDVGATAQCVSNLDTAAGAPTRVRIGGTTQDRATYDPNLTVPANFTIATPGGAPDALTYGPSFFDLAGDLAGPTTVGFNRQKNNLNNVIAAAQQANARMPNLDGIELGNEPEFYSSSDPIANGQPWNPQADIASQISWGRSIAQAIGRNIIQAGVYLQPPKWSIANLAPAEASANTLQYVKTFANHFYPQSACGGSTTNLQSLMNHTTISRGIKGFGTPEVAAARTANRPAYLAETNSATCGGGGVSPTFGAALWLQDYIMQALLTGYDRLYFHQGTIGNCQYCWWGRFSVGAPYYGAYFAATALKGVTQIAQLDDSSSNVAVYVLYSGNTPVRAVLYNSQYYTTGTRPSAAVTLTGLTKSVVTAKRLTAAAATSRQDQGQAPTFGGQTFTDGTCVRAGTAQTESTTVNGGSATFNVKATEALLVEL